MVLGAIGDAEESVDSKLGGLRIGALGIPVADARPIAGLDILQTELAVAAEEEPVAMGEIGAQQPGRREDDKRDDCSQPRERFHLRYLQKK